MFMLYRYSNYQFTCILNYKLNLCTHTRWKKKHDVELTIDVTIIKWTHPYKSMCKTADYDVKKDCNMYAIHIIKKW